MSNDTRRLGTGILVQWGVLILAGGVAWGTLKAGQLSLETRVTKAEQAISAISEQRGELRELLGRLEERLKAIQRELSAHMGDKKNELGLE